MVPPDISFTGQVGYVTDTGLVVRRLAGTHRHPWINGEQRFADLEVTDVSHTQELFPGERVFYRPKRQFGTVRHATWIAGFFCYHVELLGNQCQQGRAIWFERLTVRVGDFIKGRNVPLGTPHRGQVTRILPPAPWKPGSTEQLYQLDRTGEFCFGIPLEPVVTFEEFLQPTVAA